MQLKFCYDNYGMVKWTKWKMQTNGSRVLHTCCYLRDCWQVFQGLTFFHELISYAFKDKLPVTICMLVFFFSKTVLYTSVPIANINLDFSGRVLLKSIITAWYTLLQNLKLVLTLFQPESRDNTCKIHSLSMLFIYTPMKRVTEQHHRINLAPHLLNLTQRFQRYGI